MEVLSLITARSGSKGVPGKNIRVVGGKPLIAWSIEAALCSGVTGRVVVSTDGEEIAEVARQYGAEAPFLRPAALSGDEASSIDVALHALDWLKREQEYVADYLLLLQPTSPFRTAQDIVQAVQLAVARNAPAVVSVTPAATHPHWTKRVDEQGQLLDFIRPNGERIERRQELPPVFGLNGAIYLIRPETLRAGRSWYPAGTLAYVMPTERSIDIDTPWDLKLADLLLKEMSGELRA